MDVFDDYVVEGDEITVSILSQTLPIFPNPLYIYNIH